MTGNAEMQVPTPDDGHYSKHKNVNTSLISPTEAWNSEGRKNCSNQQAETGWEKVARVLARLHTPGV